MYVNGIYNFICTKKSIIMKKILLWIVRRVLSLRYTVELQWYEHLQHDWPLLVLPNHVALVDPRILLSFLWKYTFLSPVASEKYYNKPVLNQIMRIFGTVPIGDMTAWASSEDVQKVFEKVVDAMKSWKSILIYPSGQIYRQWYESIKWKQSVYQIVQHMPQNTKVIGVKTRWLWGSIWSMAWDNGNTSFWKIYLKCIWYVIANGIFFVPKRRVSIYIEDISFQVQKEKKQSLDNFNLFLEWFLNTEKGKKYEEPTRYLKHYFYYDNVGNKIPPECISGSEADLKKSQSIDTRNIDDSVKKEIQEKIARIKEISQETIQEDSSLILDLYFDSLDVAEVKSYIQSHFSWASNPPITDLKSVSDLYAMAAWLSTSEETLKQCSWWEKKISQNLIDTIKITENDTIISLWKQSFKNSRKEAFMWDNIFGTQTKKDVILKAYVVSHYIKKMPGQYVGIMLPSVGSASLVTIATYLAGKIPVMFNWTLGKESFTHCVNFSKVDTILTSRNFFDRITTPFLEEYQEKNMFVFLEDTLKDIPLTVKLGCLIKSMFMPIPHLSETAVVLFTSGSESLPKAVVLTHENIIENIKGALSIFKLKTDDRLLGFLPPFHSFWFTVNTIMPIITWLQVVYTPDPNDSKTILDIIGHTWVTGITATPTFLKMILALCQKPDLDSIRYVVVWAEKCPAEVFSDFGKYAPNGTILEGYGITECSPVVSINPASGSKPGTVGKIIPNLDCKILNLDDYTEVDTWEQWMIYVSWSSIFSWYLDTNIESPFMRVDGREYYKTGDLWKVDTDGFLTITGRLKRFVKIAWEMISLPFIEWILLKKYGGNSDVLKIAIEAQEQDGNVKICLFSVDRIEIEEVNDCLRKRGVSNLVKISEVIHIEEIPVLGTWKIDYKVLKEMISMDWKKIQYNFEDIEGTLKKKLAEMAEIDEWTVSRESIFGKDIVLDSIDIWELKIFIKTNYHITSSLDVSKIQTFWDLYEYTLSLKDT